MLFCGPVNVHFRNTKALVVSFGFKRSKNSHRFLLESLIPLNHGGISISTDRVFNIKVHSSGYFLVYSAMIKKLSPAYSVIVVCDMNIFPMV